jgi:hypothetical protein
MSNVGVALAGARLLFGCKTFALIDVPTALSARLAVGGALLSFFSTFLLM